MYRGSVPARRVRRPDTLDLALWTGGHIEIEHASVPGSVEEDVVRIDVPVNE
jgi:hypothetical protein